MCVPFVFQFTSPLIIYYLIIFIIIHCIILIIEGVFI